MNENFVFEIDSLCYANGLSSSQVVIVGEKNFGESCGQIYAKRHKPGYFEQYIEVENKSRYIDQNQHFANLYGDRFLDLMSMVTNEKIKFVSLLQITIS